MNEQRVFNTNEAHRVKRIAYRASYDVDVVNSILDSGYVCHIGFADEGAISVMPMTYWRDGEYLYFHSASNGRFAFVCRNADVCITVTLIDGLVLGHSPINHSANYRSVIVHGQAEALDDPQSKLDAMHSFFAKTLPGRWENLRRVREDEIAAVTVFRVKLDQVSAKIRNEFTDAEDHMPETAPWVGIIPAHLAFETPVADPRFPATTLPAYLEGFSGKPAFEDRIDRVTREHS